jgi:ribosome maturation factor RimP
VPAGKPHSGASRQLLEFITPIVTSCGLDLEDLTIQVVGRRSILRLVVDGDDGVDLDAIAGVSRQVSEALDADQAADVFGGEYLLEVSSPGIDRALTEPRHWRRAIGRLVKVPVEGTPVVGRVQAVSADAVTLGIDGRVRVLAWSELGSGKVQVEFNRVSAVDEGAKDETADDNSDIAEEG